VPHPQAAGRGGSKLDWRIGRNGGQQRPVSVAVERFTRKMAGVPLTGGQAQTVAGTTTPQLSIGPHGWGVVWYPVQVTVSSSIGALDTSTAACYLGSVALANLQGGQSYAGGGDVISLSVPGMTPGDLLIIVWQGATVGSVVTVNVQGTQDALAY
jgi:hypothetical protein